MPLNSKENKKYNQQSQHSHIHISISEFQNQKLVLWYFMCMS